METPICDFVRRYAESGALRLHMPGHKGRGALGVEHLDITEIDGADSLYEADGIIRQSEKNAGSLFGAETFYSTEGSCRYSPNCHSFCGEMGTTYTAPHIKTCTIRTAAASCPPDK